ncbi:trehalose/maltose hydrolase-like predicted phosphorylase/transcriptional regulator with XRE-family HTH domain [Nonomuraea muscovyensis]|uniref:Trehalose/maltose hydrolase-like predicted phosphorylase/transcriptional regulator with XRE-family HTH domain n=1 Tax=Nonomuraea muscovyensis TaxID=1124761 RepID=A0A7X0C5U2_9ACTN|nr:pyridoxamine 5'-phosphate oxidase family protein [Nonomuraea muscovyensis]MBB6349074.1 trehalose/maltose hydrolase-like predicted phosphorylase/transcriptional regulator with XRE-family HTH domain [Nonomuraea muscovyensis]
MTAPDPPAAPYETSAAPYEPSLAPDERFLALHEAFLAPDGTSAASYAPESAAGGSADGPWSLRYDGYDPGHEALREALCTLGNGRFATRGATPDGGARTPGTYAAGCYNRLDSTVAGRTVTNEDLVNLPDWLPLTFATPDGDWFSPDRAHLLDYRTELDMRRGVLIRSLRWRDGSGRITRVRQRRLVSMADPLLAALDTDFVAENWSGPLRVRAALDGRVTNSGVARYRELRGDHLTGYDTGTAGDLAWLSAVTRTSGITVALASRTDHGAPSPEVTQKPDLIAAEHVLDLAEGTPASLTKIVALVTSRDPAIHDPCSAALRAVRLAPRFDTLLARHEAAWARLWERGRLDVDGADIARAVRLHVFHLLQTLSPHTADLDAGVPARGLHGEAYRGHVFWDELFVLPWLNLRFPEISRGLLRYRWRRLPEARAAARAAGFDGAMFPWQSGSDGREETQTLHLNPLSGRWLPDRSHLQRHVGLAIAYNVWQHHLATGSMPPWCAELLVDIARFFASLAVPFEESGRYEIHGVMGPDEYHEHYPGAASPGLANNAYTNVMTVWLLLRALDTLELHPDLPVAEGEVEHWLDITRRMRVDFHDGVISQFGGYAELAELDWERYRGARRLDRVLESQGDDVNRYKASKQADTLMLFYLLTSDELLGLLHRLGYPAGPELIPRTIHYYLGRTSHGSTLSAVVHAWVLTRSDRARSWSFFTEALASDLEDVQGGTTAEGVHLGAMAGTLDLIQRCYLGLHLRRDGLHLDPLLPGELAPLSLPIRFRGIRYFIDADHDKTRVNGVTLARGARRTFASQQGGTTMSTGDLGRRIIHHRERLGLTREQLAERAAMAPGYVKYLEEHPDTIGTSALTRLADALQITVEDLLGGGGDRPPGVGHAQAGPKLEVLQPEECLRLIAPGGIGRVAFGGPQGPTVLPVNYKLHEGAIVFRTAYGGPMDQSLRTGLEGVEIKIGFEVDQIDEARREGWSVLVQGPAHHVPQEELRQVTGAGVSPWAGGERELYIRIVPHQITGRRIRGL